jgi:signal transduction histidine kinase
MPGSVAQLIRRPARRWLPRRTVRLRLTALYGGLFLLTVAVLLTTIYLLVAGNFQPTSVTVKANKLPAPSALLARPRQAVTGSQAANSPVPPSPNHPVYFVARSGGQVLGSFGPPGSVVADTARTIRAAVGVQQSHDRSQLLVWSALALGLMALASIVLGWLVAGRVLAPLRTMTTRARRISADSLDARLALRGPDDELKELGDTIDGLLERLERAFDAQRRFVANASHELRTPLTLERATLEVALRDPEASEASLRAACERVLAAGAEQERLIAALLDLARSERGLDHHESVALDDVVAHARGAVAIADGVRVTTVLEPARLSGDARLIERLAANLLENAIAHNVPGGWVRAVTTTESGRAVLRISNTGPKIDAGEVNELLEPFRRADGRLSHRGHGLGLSIVAAIAAAHGAELSVRARDLGGLDVELTFPPVPAGPVIDPGDSGTRGDPAGAVEALERIAP